MRRRPGPVVVLLALTGTVLAAPLLVGDKPLLARRSDGRLTCPAMRPGAWNESDGRSLLDPPLRVSWRAIQLDDALQPPSSRHFFGTDALGRDLFARVVHGARLSILVGLAATALAIGAGLVLGGAAALHGGWVDLALSRVIEVLACFPPFILAMALVAVLGGGIGSLIVAIGVGRTAAASRFARAEVLRWRGTGLWLAARASGSGRARAAVHHLLPLAAENLSVQMAFGVAQAILLESGLSFLGLGVPAPVPSWGNILAEGRATLDVAWWPILIPTLALSVVLGLLLAFDRPHGEAAR